MFYKVLSYTLIVVSVVLTTTVSRLATQRNEPPAWVHYVVGIVFTVLYVVIAFVAYLIGRWL